MDHVQSYIGLDSSHRLTCMSAGRSYFPNRKKGSFKGWMDLDIHIIFGLLFSFCKSIIKIYDGSYVYHFYVKPDCHGDCGVVVRVKTSEFDEKSLSIHCLSCFAHKVLMKISSV